MESSGGEPDIVGQDINTGEYLFFDCLAESSKGRRSLCYDQEALHSRKENKPQDNVIDVAAAMGIELLSEEQYLALQKLGNFDTKTSSWLKHPLKLGTFAVQSLLISTTIVFLCITTVQNLTTLHGHSVTWLACWHESQLVVNPFP